MITHSAQHMITHKSGAGEGKTEFLNGNSNVHPRSIDKSGAGIRWAVGAGKDQRNAMNYSLRKVGHARKLQLGGKAVIACPAWTEYLCPLKPAGSARTRYFFSGV